MLPRGLKRGVEDVVDFAHELMVEASDHIKDMTGSGNPRALTRIKLAENETDDDVITYLPPKIYTDEDVEMRDDHIATKKQGIKRLRKEQAGDVQPEHQVRKEYFFKRKHTAMDDGGVELEMYAGAVAKFLAGKEYVASARAVRGYTKYVGLISRHIPGFLPNHDDPLHDMDTVISLMEANYARSAIDGYIKILIDYLEDKVTHNTFFGLQVAGLFGGQEMNVNQFRCQLMNFRNDYSDQSLKELSRLIKKRMEKQAAKDMDEEYKILFYLNGAIRCYRDLSEQERQAQLSVRDFEELDRYLQQQNIDIEEVESVAVQMEAGEVNVPAQDIRNYRMVRGQALSWTARYILKEGDAHNGNFAKSGLAIDFGMAKYDISYHLANQMKLTEIFKKPYPSTFKCTARDLRALPCLHDASPFYWPTKSNRASQILLRTVREYIARYQRGESDDVLSQRLTELVNKIADEVIGFKQQNPSLFTSLVWGAEALINKIESVYRGISVERVIDERRRQQVGDVIGGLLKKYLTENAEKLSWLEEQIDEMDRRRHELKGRHSSLYSDSDNLVFYGLAVHPVMIFHKYKTLLKYILTNQDIYEAFADLYISTQRSFNDGGKFAGRNLAKVIVEDEAARIAEIKDVLLKMPDFKEFLERDGAFALDMIRREFAAHAEKYAKNVEEKPWPYAEMSEVMQSLDIDARYREICAAVGIHAPVADLMDCGPDL